MSVGRTDSTEHHTNSFTQNGTREATFVENNFIGKQKLT